jgi:penicillin-binding protein 2
MALAALTYGKRRPEQAIHDPGFYNFGNHVFRDDKVGGHGGVDMYKSIVVSCDTYYYMLANDLGIDNIANFMQLFGFGSRSGIDLTGESAGILPSQAWKRRRFRTPEQQKWYAGETISNGIGQGYNSNTPLQLAQAIATLANDGVMYRPHVVNFIEDIVTRNRTMVEPQPLRSVELKPEHLKTVKDALIGVNVEGTGARAFAGASYVSAGKTGTAQVIAIKQGEKYVASRVAERHRDHALFVAYAPANAPKIAVAVVVENAGFGAVTAAPIARKVFDYYLLGKKVAPVTTEELNANTTAR